MGRLRLRPSRIFWIGAAALRVAAALVALGAVARGDFSDTDGRILSTLGAALLAGSTLIAGLTLAERGARAPGWACAAVAVPGFALVLYAIVLDGGGDATRVGWSGGLVLVAALVDGEETRLAPGERLALRGR
jgi:hypothetical protein